MNLEEQIRRYTEAMDSMASPVEDLIPSGMAEDLEISPRPTVEVRIPLGPPRRPRRRLPGWAWGLAAAVAVIVLSIPLYLWLSDSPPDVADTTPTSVVTSQNHGLTFDLGTQTLQGAAWPPNVEITASLSGIPDTTLTTTSDATGSFTVGPFSGCCVDSLLTVTDGETSKSVQIPWAVTIWRVDPAADVIAGTVSTSGDVFVRILGGSDTYETVVTPLDEKWLIELAGTFDIIPGMTVEASLPTEEVTFTVSSGVFIDAGLDVLVSRGLVAGVGWAPNAVLQVAVDGVSAPGGVLSDAAGFFSLSVGLSGLELTPGSVLTVGDGTSEVNVTIPELTFDTLDPAGGVASGTADVPDVTVVSITLELGPVGGDGGQDEQRYFDVTVVGGQWQVEFEPPVPGRVIRAAWVIDFERGAAFRVDFDTG